jgi:G3E family GTPase
LRNLPISRGIPEQVSHEPELELSENAKEALQRVVRSKGFVWLGDSNVAANYWSHSGSAFELQCLGRWWATLARPEWPPEAVDSILNDFDDNDHDEDDTDANTVGDRRNEIVFIGPGLSDTVRQGDIVSTLNQCLLDESEWKLYKQKRLDGNALKATFESPLSAKMLSY